MNNQAVIKEILQYNTIAVVGFSPKKDRPSNFVSMYMKGNGYEIIPVNPGHHYIGRMRSYPNLESIKKKIEIVNIFRRSKYVSDIVESAILIEAKAIWMQDSICDHEAAKAAREAGLLVVMDDCLLRQHKSISIYDTH